MPDGNPWNLKGKMTPSQYCKKFKTPEKAGAKCQIFMAMPPPKVIFDQWTGLINGIYHEFDDHEDNLVRDITMFNQILTQEAKRLKVKMNNKTMPDPERLFHRLAKVVKCFKKQTKKYKNEALVALEQAEMIVSKELAIQYGNIAGPASAFDKGINPDYLPTNDNQALALGRGVLGLLDNANSDKSIDPVFKEIIAMVKGAGLPTSGAKVSDLSDLFDGFIQAGLGELGEPNIVE